MSQAGSYIYLKSDLRSRPLWGIYISIQPDIDEIYPIFKEFSSPMGYLYFYSLTVLLYKGSELTVLVPYGVSTFLFEEEKSINIFCKSVLVPYGVSIFLFHNNSS